MARLAELVVQAWLLSGGLVDGTLAKQIERAATSGIGRRSWLDPDGRPAHHLLDPSTGSPAFTGLVQATAFAPTAAVAEVRAKAALLSGPGSAGSWLPDGGVLVFDDGHHLVIEKSAAGTAA